MAIYLKKFSTHQEYEAFTATTAFIKPNVSICTTEGDVHYNPYVELETRVVAKYNITGTNYKSRIASGTSNFSKIEIDGVEQPNVTTGYTFDTVGEHTVKYTLTDPTSVGFNAFCMCTGMTSVVIPYTVTSIGRSAFDNCHSLTSITIPDSVTSIGYMAFYNSGALKRINSDTDGVCNIPSGVTSIDSRAFCRCRGLTSIVIPDSVVSISSETFSACSSVTSVVLSDSVRSIGNSAFGGCTSLTSIDIPSSVTSIGSNAFKDTPWWSTYSADTSHHYGNIIYICDIAYEAINKNITSVIFRNNTTSISTYAFASCSGLTNIVIPDSVTSIDYGAFYYCSGITSCTIGSGVTSIGESAFYYCRNLTSITSNATTAPTIQSNTFRNVKTGGTLRVPSGSSGYDVWMQNANYYLGLYNWTKVER